MPPRETREALERIMHSRPGLYPRFTPHITIGSARSYADARKGIPADRSPVAVRFHDVIAGPGYFSAVFVAIAQDAQIMQLETTVRAGLGSSAMATPRYPHQTFAYMDGEGARVQLVNEYMQRGVFRTKEGGEGRVLNCGGGVLVDGYTADAIWIVDCNGPIAEWQVLEVIALDGPTSCQ
jgi:2',3'-cyclic-nucleotide 3'-phosphodiesterase